MKFGYDLSGSFFRLVYEVDVRFDGVFGELFYGCFFYVICFVDKYSYEICR